MLDEEDRDTTLVADAPDESDQFGFLALGEAGRPVSSSRRSLGSVASARAISTRR